MGESYKIKLKKLRDLFDSVHSKKHLLTCDEYDRLVKIRCMLNSKSKIAAHTLSRTREILEAFKEIVV